MQVLCRVPAYLYGVVCSPIGSEHIATSPSFILASYSSKHQRDRVSTDSFKRSDLNKKKRSPVPASGLTVYLTPIHVASLSFASGP
jgi:hypothetical protein